MRLGIDLGTTRTVVAAAIDGRYPPIAFETGDGYCDYLPGLAVLNRRQWSFGWEADGLLHTGFSAAVRSVKRAVSGLAPDDLVPDLGGFEESALSLITRYVEHLRTMLSERSNLDANRGEKLEAMIAVPANASTRQRYLTVEAFRRAGFEVLGVLNEPTAAAIEFARHNLGAIGERSPKRYVVVYDLGGGTFDTAAVSLVARRFELLETEGIQRLGGNDFDALLAELVLERLGPKGEALATETRLQLLEVCRLAKETLRATTRRLAVDVCDLLELSEPVIIDVSDLYARAQPLVDRTLKLVERIFERLPACGIDPENPRELGAVYLVGGAASFPLVSRELRKRYKRKIQLAPQPHAATAVGLAIAADDQAGVFVREAVTRHFGVWREGEHGREKVFDPILSKNAAASANGGLQVVRRYRPEHAVGHLRFMECSELTSDCQPAGDLTPWGEVYFPYDPHLTERTDLRGCPMDRRPELCGEEITETYSYAENGTISVQIENSTRGYRRSYVLGRHLNP